MSYPPAFLESAAGRPERLGAAAPAHLSRRPRLTLILLGLLPVLLVSACAGSDGPDERARLNQQRLQIMQRFAVAQNEIRNTQVEALGHPDLRPLREQFNERLRTRILAIDPSADSLLERARVVGDQMEEMSRPLVLQQGQEPPAYDRAAVVREFRAVEQAIQPLQQQAMSDPEVFAAFTSLQDSLHATMLGMDPDVGPTLIRMEALSVQLEEVDAELRALSEPE